MIPALALGGCKSALEIPVVETGWDIYTGVPLRTFHHRQQRRLGRCVVRRSGRLSRRRQSEIRCRCRHEAGRAGQRHDGRPAVRRNQTVLFGTRDLPESTGEKRIAYVQPVPVGYRL